MKTKHFRKWVSDLMKLVIIATFILGILYGISESMSGVVMLFSIVMLAVSYFLRKVYLKSVLFRY